MSTISPDPPRLPGGYRFVSLSSPPERFTIDFSPNLRSITPFIDDMRDRQRAAADTVRDSNNNNVDDPCLVVHLMHVEMVNADPAKSIPWDGSRKLGADLFQFQFKNRQERRAHERAWEKTAEKLEKTQGRAPKDAATGGASDSTTASSSATTTESNSGGGEDGGSQRPAKTCFLVNLFDPAATRDMVNTMIKKQTEAGAEAISLDYWGVAGDEELH